VTELITRSSKLTPYTKRPKQVPSFATAYDFEPEDEAARSLGTLYVVIEVVGSGREAESTADLVIETIGHTYFALPAESEDLPRTASLTQFENAVKAANQALAEFTHDGHAQWIGKMSAVIAVLAGNELHLTHAGSAEGYLYRQRKNIRISGPAGNGFQTHKPFASIASGHLESGDRLLFATPTVFHLASRPELDQILQDSTANAAITKIHDLVKNQAGSNRMAAIVVEITTPELISAHSLPDEPAEISLGQPQSVMQAAQITAGPLLNQAAKQIRGGAIGLLTWLKRRGIPALRHAGLLAVAATRWLLRARGRAKRLLLAAAVIATVLTANQLVGSRSRQLNSLVMTYRLAYQVIQAGQAELAAGDKTAARAHFVEADQKLAVIVKAKAADKVDAQLKKQAHPEDDPASVDQLGHIARSAIDAIDGVVRPNLTLISDFSDPKSAKPTLIELTGNILVLVEGQENPRVLTIRGGQNQLKTSAASLTHRAVASAVSSAGEGVFILTDEPAVWLYKPADDSLVKQSVSLGEWPRGRDIASFNGNLYILAADSSQIFRLLKIFGGFASPSPYLSAGRAPALAGALSLAVDGTVYAGGVEGGATGYLVGSPQISAADLPDTLTHPVTLESLAEGSILLAADGRSNRLGSFNLRGNNLVTGKQYVLPDSPKLVGATADQAATTIYALLEDKLVKFPLVP
jgi:serine/threonine protein phosphatase PrpC